MTGLERWLARAWRRQQLRPDLLAALISGRGFAYARHRLGPVVTRLVLRTLLHGLEMYLLSVALPFEYFAPLLTYRALAALLGAVHWGALEGLRADVRGHVRTRRIADARRAVEGWLWANTLIALVPFLWFAARIARERAGGDAVSLFDAYGFACGARLLCDVVARTYHAGIYAVRRVHRPLATLLAADVLEIALFVAGFARFGAWCIPVAVVIAGVLDAVLGLRAARRAYLRARLLPPRVRAVFGAWHGLQAAAVWRALTHSAANASLQLDALLLLLLVRVDPPREGRLSFAVLYYVMRPLLGFATHWVRTFYFDLARLDAGALALFRARLLTFLQKLAFGCALFVSATTLLGAQLLWPELMSAQLLWLAPLFAARSFFALRQLIGFAAGHHRQLLVAGACLGLGLVVLAFTAQRGWQVIGGATLLLLLAAQVLRPQPTAAAGATEDPTALPLPLGRWLRELRRAGQVRVALLAVDRRSGHAGRVFAALTAAFPSARLARCGRSQLLLFVPSECALEPSALVAAAGGALGQLWLSPTCTGAHSIGLAREQGALPELLDAALSSPRAKTAAELSVEFRRNFPQGELLDFGAGVGTLALQRVPSELLPEFLHQLLLCARQRERSARTRLPVELCVFAPDARPELAFIVPRATPGFATFRSEVRAASLHASFYVELRPERGRAIVGGDR